MHHPGLTLHGESLRRAIRYLSDFHVHQRQDVEAVALRFDLSPIEEEFLLRYFAESRAQSPPPR